MSRNNKKSKIQTRSTSQKQKNYRTNSPPQTRKSEKKHAQGKATYQDTIFPVIAFFDGEFSISKKSIKAFDVENQDTYNIQIANIRDEYNNIVEAASLIKGRLLKLSLDWNYNVLSAKFMSELDVPSIYEGSKGNLEERKVNFEEEEEKGKFREVKRKREKSKGNSEERKGHFEERKGNFEERKDNPHIPREAQEAMNWKGKVTKIVDKVEISCDAQDFKRKFNIEKLYFTRDPKIGDEVELVFREGEVIEVTMMSEDKPELPARKTEYQNIPQANISRSLQEQAFKIDLSKELLSERPNFSSKPVDSPVLMQPHPNPTQSTQNLPPHQLSSSYQPSPNPLHTPQPNIKFSFPQPGDIRSFNLPETSLSQSQYSMQSLFMSQPSIPHIMQPVAHNSFSPPSPQNCPLPASIPIASVFQLPNLSLPQKTSIKGSISASNLPIMPKVHSIQHSIHPQSIISGSNSSHPQLNLAQGNLLYNSIPQSSSTNNIMPYNPSKTQKLELSSSPVCLHPIGPVGDQKLPIDALKTPNSSNLPFISMIDTLSTSYEFLRLVKKDGNSFYRALGVIYLEHLCSKSTEIGEFEYFLSRLNFLFQDPNLSAIPEILSFQESLSTLMKIKINFTSAVIPLQDYFKDPKFDAGMILAIRNLSARYLEVTMGDINFRGVFSGDNLISRVRTLGVEAEKEEYLALANSFGVKINVATIGQELKMMNYEPVEGSYVCSQVDVVNMNGQHDILYSKEKGI